MADRSAKFVLFIIRKNSNEELFPFHQQGAVSTVEVQSVNPMPELQNRIRLFSEILRRRVQAHPLDDSSTNTVRMDANPLINHLSH